MEQESEDVKVGGVLGEQRYNRVRKETILPGAGAFDFVKKGDMLEIHDINKSRSMQHAHTIQLLYYLWYLKGKGINATGVINYPLHNKHMLVELTEGGFREVEEALNKIEKILSGPLPPHKWKRYCPRCSYFEFCWGSVVEEGR